MDENVLWIIAAGIGFYLWYSWQQRQKYEPPAALTETYWKLRHAGHESQAVQLLCAIACRHPYETATGGMEQYLTGHMDYPEHRASLLLAYQAMHDQSPRSPGLTYKLAYLYHRDGRDSDAARLIDDFVPTSPENDPWRVYIRTHRRNLAEYLDYYEARHRESPEDIDITYRLAYLYHFSERYAEAAKLINASPELIRRYDPWRIRMLKLKEQLSL